LERAALDARNEAGPGKEPDGNRWNDCHYSNEIKRKAKKGQGL
jgi:hypothetical protein